MVVRDWGMARAEEETANEARLWGCDLRLRRSLTVVMLPVPSQSHLNQLLHLAVLIFSATTLPVHFLGSATHNRQVKLRHYPNPNPNHIHFHDFPTPPIPTPDPDPSPNKTPNHLGLSMAAYTALRHPIATLIQKMSTETKKKVLIYNRLIAKAVEDSVSIPNVESYAFNCLLAFNLFHILREYSLTTKPFPLKVDENLSFSVRDFYPLEFINYIVSRPEHFKNRARDIHNTSRLVGGENVDLLAREEIIGGESQQWAICPMLGSKKVADCDESGARARRRHTCLDWLDGQARGSVLYVSFGTTISLSGEEAREIALGLESYGFRKIIELPEGFEERVKGAGIRLVVRDWAPQVEILAHEATGGFLTHCGWNSCFESLMTGVPVLAWPMHTDQSINAIFMTKVLKTGLVARDWEKREELVRARVVKDAVGRLMAAGEEGDDIRRRAAEIGVAIQKAAASVVGSWRGSLSILVR
ncbi:UDP-glucose glucosyltransferase [Striga asiatica]|uniref:Glycosyltransferase n=1 Tax=Striga asiatica TaxID=4170 RepID=A0A5A7RK78_STRAF|nr:UDP-glucose glucosyltransferase [Striga asiatica]